MFITICFIQNLVTGIRNKKCDLALEKQAENKCELALALMVLIYVR